MRRRQGDTVYRTFGPPERALRIGCGQIWKPTRADITTSFCRADCHVVVYLLAGSGLYRDADHSVRVRPGDLIHRLPGRAHETIPDEDGAWHEAFLTHPAFYWEGLVAAGIPGDEPVWRIGIRSELVVLASRIKNSLERNEDRTPLQALHLMQEFLLLAWQFRKEGSAAPMDRAIDEACRALGRDFGQPVSLPALSDQLGVGYEVFRKRFRERLGVAPGVYRQRARMDQARTLLSGTRLTIQEIARELGYVDGFAFSKEFKRNAGISPSVYRRQAEL